LRAGWAARRTQQREFASVGRRRLDIYFIVLPFGNLRTTTKTTTWLLVSIDTPKKGGTKSVYCILELTRTERRVKAFLLFLLRAASAKQAARFARSRRVKRGTANKQAAQRPQKKEERKRENNQRAFSSKLRIQMYFLLR